MRGGRKRRLNTGVLTDQGTALTCDAINDLLDNENQFQSLCAKHVIKTIELARAKEEFSGSMSGVRELIYKLARSRATDYGDKVLADIERKNRDVANYLRDRRDN